jgi:hypothetical protein
LRGIGIVVVGLRGVSLAFGLPRVGTSISPAARRFALIERTISGGAWASVAVSA